jgi:hypothetical protein
VGVRGGGREDIGRGSVGSSVEKAMLACGILQQLGCVQQTST